MEQRELKEYLMPETMEEALDILSDTHKKICILAGATDVYVGENQGTDAYLDITRIGLSYIEKREGNIAIGAGTTFDELIRSTLVQEEAACLWEAAKNLADKTIRNVATIGGNICTAVPSGDSLTPLLALDAKFILKSSNEERTVEAKDFFLGVRKTARKANEILKEIVFPIRQKNENSTFMKQGRNSEDIAMLNVAVCMVLEADDIIQQIRIANGAVAPTPVRAVHLEKALQGKKMDQALIEANIEKLEQDISPITNVRGTAKYRMDVSKVFTKRALMQTYQKIKER